MADSQDVPSNHLSPRRPADSLHWRLDYSWNQGQLCSSIRDLRRPLSFVVRFPEYLTWNVYRMDVLSRLALFWEQNASLDSLRNLLQQTVWGDRFEVAKAPRVWHHWFLSNFAFHSALMFQYWAIDMNFLIKQPILRDCFSYESFT